MLKTISPPCWQSGLCLGPECSLDTLIMLLTNFSMCEVQVYTSHLWKTSTMNSLMSPKVPPALKKGKTIQSQLFICRLLQDFLMSYQRGSQTDLDEFTPSKCIWVEDFYHFFFSKQSHQPWTRNTNPLFYSLIWDRNSDHVMFFGGFTFKFILITYHWLRNYFPRTHLAKYKLTSGMLRNPYSWGRMDLLDRCTVCLTDS